MPDDSAAKGAFDRRQVATEDDPQIVVTDRQIAAWACAEQAARDFTRHVIDALGATQADFALHTDEVAALSRHEITEPE